MGVVREMSVFIFHNKWNQTMSNNQDLEHIDNKTEPDKQTEKNLATWGNSPKQVGQVDPWEVKTESQPISGMTSLLCMSN